jgi:hypothetical protein
MAYQYIKGAVSASLGGSAEQTGSFVKLQAIGAQNGQSTLSRIEFGELTVPEASFTASNVVTNIIIPNGDCIEAPIARFKVGGGAFLGYTSN